jgi:hypothetical protein
VKPLAHAAAEQSASVGSWQTGPELVCTQLSPVGQSTEVWQASWQTLFVHTKGWLQSLLSVQVPPTSIFIGEPLQPSTSHDEKTIKPRTRDADISILQFGPKVLECWRVECITPNRS